VQISEIASDAQILPGLILGVVMPFIFSAMTMMTLSHVSHSISAKAAHEEQVRCGKHRRSIKKIAAWGVASAIVHLLVPAAIAVSSTVGVFIIFGVRVLTGFIAGNSLL
jgi:K(+)-stimulated pyrophosphate-energized sodium pump